MPSEVEHEHVLEHLGGNVWVCVNCREQVEPSFYCNLHHGKFPATELEEHLRAHGITLDRWRDGGPVVVDTALEPEDFA
jgi:hypothetical protein